MMNVNWKITFLHTLVLVALVLIIIGGLGVFFAVTYDDRSVDFFLPMLQFVFWPGLLLPEWETKGFLVPLVGFVTTLFLYSGVVTIFIEGIKRMREK